MTSGDLLQHGIRLFDQWTAMWNLELELAERITAPEFTLRCAQAAGEVFDGIRTPPRLADLIATWHRGHPGLRFSAEGAAAVDPQLVDGRPRGLVARPYLASFTTEEGGGTARSGTEILRITDGPITEVGSVSGGVAGAPSTADRSARAPAAG